MARVTIASLQERIVRLEAQVADARANDVEEVSLRRLSSVLLDRVSCLQAEVEEEMGQLVSRQDALASLYSSVDGTDDLVIEYETT
jgi:hypothetical protein